MTYWFKRRRYGWGWTPSTWQGWALLVAMVLLVLVPAFVLPRHDGTGATVGFLMWTLGVVAVFVAVATAKGPRPRWRWGKSDRDDPDEDF